MGGAPPSAEGACAKAQQLTNAIQSARTVLSIERLVSPTGFP